MSVPLERPATPAGLFLWVLHRFAEVFEEHAIVKGGIELQLFDCARSTTDIDYVFVPYTSKNDVRKRIEAVLHEAPDARVTVALHSKMLRATLAVDDAAIQVEVNVARECPSTPMSTSSLAHRQGQPSRIVRVMEPACALAHKLAAWNERRLLRDLYDAWFLSTRIGAEPDLEVLGARLSKIDSRHPELRGVKRMTRDEFAGTLRAAAAAISAAALRDELEPLLPSADLVGLLPRLRASTLRLAERLEDASAD